MASGRSSPQKQILQGHIQRLAQVKRNKSLRPIAQVTFSVCGTLLARTDDKLLVFKANVADIASWIIFFDENSSCVNENVANKIRKTGQLCTCLEAGERIVDGETAKKTFSFHRKAADLDDVNDVIDRRLGQFNEWWGKEHKAWKEKVQTQGADGGTPTVGDSCIEPHLKLENKECPKTKAVTSRSGTLEDNGCQSRTQIDLPGTHDPEGPSSALRQETTTVRETANCDSRPRDTSSSIGNTEHPTSSEGTSASRLVSENSFSGDTLASTAFPPPSTATNLEEEGMNPQFSRQSDPTSAQPLTPADNMLDSASNPEPTPQEDNTDDFFDGDDPENTEYDFLIHHEPEDEDKANSIRDQMQRQLKDKSGKTTAKVCIPSDFHYKGLRPKPLLAAVEKSTSVAFFISKCSGDMCRKESILSSLDFLMTTAKNSKQHIKTIFVLVKGNQAEAVALLKNDNPYLQTTAAAGAVYDVTAPYFSKKISQLFRENQHLTITRRVKSQPRRLPQSEMGRPITHESGSASDKQLHEDRPPPYSENTAIPIAIKFDAAVEKLRLNSNQLQIQTILQ